MEDLRVELDGAVLVGSYSPAGRTAVVAVHGAGEGKRDWYLYRHLHEVLPAAGIGVLTFDRRGEGESTGEPSRGRFAVQADDALAFGCSLQLEGFGLWGISQGGWVGPLAAARSELVTFLVLLASTGVTPAEQMRYAVAEQIQRAGFGPDAAARAVELRAKAEAWIRGDSIADLASAWKLLPASRGGRSHSSRRRFHLRATPKSYGKHWPKRCFSIPSRSSGRCERQRSSSMAMTTAGLRSSRAWTLGDALVERRLRS
jgi:pimeloyl-ACP methyl ester carboxylesterase